jgi:glycosyltransferase involved in cell wall biosynthesis
VLIVAEHASARFGGEAALPLHYFRVMRKRGVDVRMITHDRVEGELRDVLKDDIDRVYFIKDDALHKWLWKISTWMPARISYFTTGFASRAYTQVLQRRLARRLVRQFGIDLVHQPMPVSPREPSLMHGLGAPVVIGPLNGNMHYPPAFRSPSAAWKRHVETVARAIGDLLNVVFPGKPRAAAILVANERTREALPPKLRRGAFVVVENGVDLAVWQRPAARSLEPSDASVPDVTHFVFMGRLVDWKAVDLLLLAFDQARRHAPMSLTILGDGPCGDDLRRMADKLGMTGSAMRETGRVFFAGWQSQVDCARQLRLSHALVLSSLSECGGAVVLEAMSCGLPVVATAWGGPLDYLDEATGFLVEPTSRDALVDGLSKGMLALASSHELRERMGQAARRRIESDFDWDRKVDAVFTIYEQAVASAATP